MDSSRLSIKLSLGKEVRDLKDELDVHIPNLSEELAAQPAWYAYYASLLAEASSDHEQEKSSFDKIEAEVSSETRKRLKMADPKTTEKKIESAVQMDPRVQSLRQSLIEKRRTVDILKVAVKSFEQRLQAMISIAALERMQMQIDPMVRQPQPSPAPRPVIQTKEEALRILEQEKKAVGTTRI
jgi:hypothetical protein